MSFDPRREDYQRLGLRFARELDGSDPATAVHVFSSFGRRFASMRDTLPQSDADRAFHLVADAAVMVDHQLPFAPDEQVDGLVGRAQALLDEAVALDGGCYDAVRMRFAGTRPSFESSYDFLSERAPEVLAACRAQAEAAAADSFPDRARLGSDIAMAFDHVIALPNVRRAVQDAMERTVRWALRCKKAHVRDDQAQFAIVQGGLEYDLRAQCAKELADMDFPGYAIGGLSVGETPEEMYDCIEATVEHMPETKPRYLMGVGRPEDLLEGILRGVDMFDCVMPSRNGRNAMAFTSYGPMRLRNARYERDPRPLEEDCPCPACRRSRAYIRHLFIAEEMLGPILLTIHNITYYQRLMAGARRAIEEDRYVDFYRERFAKWAMGTPD